MSQSDQLLITGPANGVALAAFLFVKMVTSLLVVLFLFRQTCGFIIAMCLHLVKASVHMSDVIPCLLYFGCFGFFMR